MTRRFRYPLEPVLLTRTWALDDLLLALGERNAAIADQAQVLEKLRNRATAAAGAWAASMEQGHAQSVDQFVMATRFLSDLAGQEKAAAARMEELVQLRDALIDQVVNAKRAVEAAEQHRGQMQAAFVRERLSGDFKVADDQWNTLQSGVTADDN